MFYLHDLKFDMNLSDEDILTILNVLDGMLMYDNSCTKTRTKIKRIRDKYLEEIRRRGYYESN